MSMLGEQIGTERGNVTGYRIVQSETGPKVDYYQSASPEWLRLNGVAAVFEYEVDENGSTTAKIWEWK
jgi:hypothetical protein